jgi:hypothetical protein
LKEVLVWGENWASKTVIFRGDKGSKLGSSRLQRVIFRSFIKWLAPAGPAAPAAADKENMAAGNRGGGRGRKADNALYPSLPSLLLLFGPLIFFPQNFCLVRKSVSPSLFPPHKLLN